MSNDVFARLKALAAERFGAAADGLCPDDDFFEGLGIDSLAALDLLTDIEDAFDVEIPDYEVQGVKTLGGLAEVIGRHR
jgi:acyl carrier protein